MSWIGRMSVYLLLTLRALSLSLSISLTVIIFWSILRMFHYFNHYTAETFTWLFLEYFITKLYVCILHVMIRMTSELYLTHSLTLSLSPSSIFALFGSFVVSVSMASCVFLTINFKLYFSGTPLHVFSRWSKQKNVLLLTRIPLLVHRIFFSLRLDAGGGFFLLSLDAPCTNSIWHKYVWLNGTEITLLRFIVVRKMNDWIFDVATWR